MQFEQVNAWSDILELSDKEQKPIFLDAYAPWCKECRRMDKDVFQDKELSVFFNEHFLNVKIDITSAVGKILAKDLDIIFLPTMLILNSDGYVTMRLEGGKTTMELLSAGKFMSDRMSMSN